MMNASSERSRKTLFDFCMDGYGRLSVRQNFYDNPSSYDGLLDVRTRLLLDVQLSLLIWCSDKTLIEFGILSF